MRKQVFCPRQQTVCERDPSQDLIIARLRAPSGVPRGRRVAVLAVRACALSNLFSGTSLATLTASECDEPLSREIIKFSGFAAISPPVSGLQVVKRQLNRKGAKGAKEIHKSKTTLLIPSRNTGTLKLHQAFLNFFASARNISIPLSVSGCFSIISSTFGGIVSMSAPISPA
jgi:hypothetical protein